MMEEHLDQVTAEINALLSHLLVKHPMPWTIERDWTYEILDSGGAVVTKVMHSSVASDLIARAEKIVADAFTASMKCPTEVDNDA